MESIVLYFVLGACLFLPIFMFNYMIAAHRTFKKRMKLIPRWATSGEVGLACKEFDEVTYERHARSCFWLQNPKKLYGPLIQGIWDQDYPTSHYDDFWWRCYNEIYLNLGPFNQSRVKYIMVKSQVGLPNALRMIPLDLDAWLYQPAPKLAMADGADEYDEIMMAQEIMHHG